MSKLSRLISLHLLEFAGKDANVGAGYGRLGSPKGASITANAPSLYPYTEEPVELDDEVEKEELDDDVIDGFLSKIGIKLYKNSGNRPDRGSLAHTSQRGLGESFAGTSISPSPGLYRDNLESSADGRKLGTPYRTGPQKNGGEKGSKAGWFGAPPPIISIEDEPAYTLEDILDSDEMSLAKAKKQHKDLVREFNKFFSEK